MPDNGMRLGVVFPHGDPGFGESGEASREFCRVAEQEGFDYLAVPDHVAGVDPAGRADWPRRARVKDPYREVFVHLGFLSGMTRLELMPCVLVLPQRQAVLAAKQAAEIDILTGGRFRLGVGAGWNAVESGALGADFATRGARFDEQLRVMRLLWTEDVVVFHGEFHDLDRVGIAPRPVQRPIPLWIGGGPSRVSPRPRPQVFQRIAAVADGWVSSPSLSGREIADAALTIARYAEGAGRDPRCIGLQASVKVAVRQPGVVDRDAVLRRLAALRATGATHATFESRDAGRTISEHRDIIGQLSTLAGAG
jgi:probable F420-dependent oxidoreductase